MSEPYANERRLAVAIAGADPGSAHLRFAEAVVGSPEHGLTYTSRAGACSRRYGIKASYHNDFGPTCGVDDTLETMLMSDWIKACNLIVWLKLEKAGLDPADYVFCGIRPSVTFVPERDSPIIHEVRLEFDVEKDVWDTLRKADRKKTRTAKRRTEMSSLIMEFRISHTHTAVELALDAGGTGMYVISSVHNYDNELRPAVRIEECRIADRDLALHAFGHHCRRLVGDWRAG